MNRQIALVAVLAVAVVLTCVSVTDDIDANPVSDGFGGYVVAGDSLSGDKYTWTFDGVDTITFMYNGSEEDPTMNNQGSDGTLEGDWSAYSGSVTKAVFVDVTQIGSHLLCGFSKLTSIEVTSSDDSPIAITSIGNYAFDGCTELKDASAVLKDGLRSIGNSAFNGSGITGDVVIPDSVTEIGKYAFSNTDIGNLTLGAGVASIGNNAFTDCDNLRTVEFTGDEPPEMGTTPFKTNPKFEVPSEAHDAYSTTLEEAVGGTPSVNDYEAQIGEEQYLTLQSAIDAASDGQTITLLKNVSTDTTMEIDSSIIIDGQGQYSITSGEGVVVSILIQTDNLAVTLQNITVNNTYSSASDGNNPTTVVRVLGADGLELKINNCTFSSVSVNARGIDARGSMEPSNPTTIVSGVSIELSGFTYRSDYAQRAVGFYGAKDSKVTINDDSDILVNYYAINLATYTSNITVDVDESKIQGWAVLNSYSVESQFSFNGCELIGYNDFPYNAEGWNNFAVFVLDGGSYTGMEPGVAARGNTLTVENCSITANSVSGNNQAIIAYQYDGQQNSVIMNNCTVVATGADGAVLEPSIHVDATESKLIVDGKENIIPDTDEDESVIVSFNPVAEIGEIGYSSLVTALESAKTGDTVSLLTDCQTTPVTISAGITLDLGENTLTILNDRSNGYGLKFTTGSSTIMNGSIMDGRSDGNTTYGFNTIWVEGENTSLNLEATEISSYEPNSTENYNYIIHLEKGTSLTLGEDTVLSEKAQSSGSLTYGTDTWGVVGVAAWAYAEGQYTSDSVPTRVTVEDGATIETSGFAITGNGASHHTLFTINGGTITSLHSQAIYHPQKGTINVNGGTISGLTGIEIRSGTLNMTGGEVNGATEGFDAQANANGSTTSAVGIAVVQHTTENDIVISIKGGTISGYRALTQANTQGNEEPIENIGMSVTGGKFIGVDDSNEENSSVSAENVSGFITGGTFVLTDANGNEAGDQSLNQSGVMATGREVSAEGSVELSSEVEAVVLLNDSPYESIFEALGAAQSGDTITLLNHLAVDKMVELNVAGITLDLGGFTLSAESFSGTGSGLNLVTVTAEDITVRNGTIQTSAVNNNALNIYNVDRFTVEDVVLDNSANDGHAPMVVNSSSVTIGGNMTFMATAGDHPHGINVGYGSSTDANCSISFDSGAQLHFNGCIYGMYVDPEENPSVSIQYNGVTYYYNSESFQLLYYENNTSITENGEPIDGTNPTYKVTITVVGVSDYNITVSDDNGNVYQPETDGTYLLGSGEYKVTVTAEGYIDAVRTIAVDGSSTEFSINMNPEGTDPIPEPGPGGDDTPVINPPIIDDDDDYVPLPPQIVYDDADDGGDSTAVVACAAAAVVAALIAAFLILEYRRK